MAYRMFQLNITVIVKHGMEPNPWVPSGLCCRTHFAK